MEYVPNRARQVKRADLSPRLIRQCLNPLKQVAIVDVVLKRAESDLSDFVESEQSGRSLSRGCIGTFWDDVNKKTVIVNLGLVICYFPFQYRAVSSQLTPQDLSRVEGTASYLNRFGALEHGAERSEHRAETEPNGPGPYVIPGQTPTDGNLC